MEQQFYKLSKGHLFIFFILLLLSIIPFLFILSPTKFLGISLFAWLLTLVMIITPLITLGELYLTRRRKS